MSWMATKLSTVLPPPLISSRSIPELAAMFELRVAYPMDGILYTTPIPAVSSRT